MAAASWKKAVSGNWTLAADWSTGTVPGAGDDATLGVAGPYIVALTSAVTVHSITVSDLGAVLAIAAPGKSEAVTTTLRNAGTVEVDAAGAGGTSLKIGGTLSNSGVFAIGDAGLTSATTVTAAALVNTGTIELTGGAAQATLDITGSTVASLTGNYILRGNALLEVESGSISPSGGSVTAIAGNAELVLDGAKSRVGQSTATGSNSGLTGLTSNAGTLAVQLGSSITTGASLTNTGMIQVDNDIFGTGDAGGSSLKIGGILTNRGDLDIGNSGLTTAATVTATGLANAANGTISLTGGTAQASLSIAGAAPTALTGFFFLQGNALLQFGSGHITGIAANSELSLGGAKSRVALAAAPSGNSALTLLAGNNGILDLEDASVTTTTAFANRNQLDVDGGSKLTLGGALANAGDLEISGGSTLSVGGALSNTGSLEISAAGVATLVTAGALGNTGTVDISGDAARATLDSTAAAPTTLLGRVDLSGNALMEFASGSFTTIAAGASLGLDGPRARVALNTNTAASGALAHLASNAGSFDLAEGAAVATTVGLTNTGTLSLDSSFSGFGSSFNNDGGSSLTVGGVLTNTSGLAIGNSNILAATTLTAAGLANTGTIDLTGSAAARASLLSTAAAPTIWTGTANLSGDALLEFASGGITAIGAGDGLSLDGATALVALSTAPTTNSALTKLASNAGSFSLADGEALTTTVAFANTGSVALDASGSGGTRLSLGGALTNTSSFTIGNSAITAATIVTAHGLANTGTIDLTGNAISPVVAVLNIAAAAPSTLIGSYALAGDALLEYASGGITAIAGGAALSLDGALSRVSASGKIGSNSALTGLAANAGSLGLADGAAVATTTGLTNTGSLGIDSGFFFSGGAANGGSSLAVGGALTNNASLQIGNSGLAKASTVTASGLANSGTITLAGGAAQADLKIAGAAGNTGSVSLSDSALSTTTGFTNSGSVVIDAFGGGGGSSLTVGGTLTNSNFVEIGNSGITKTTTATASGLVNTGTIELTGGTAVQATLNIKTAAPTTLMAGTLGLSGDALLEYASGGITAIGSGAQLSLNGAQSRVALSTATTSNSALTKLAANAGSFSLADGTVITTTAFNNSDFVAIDNSGGGGSRLTVGGALTNSGFAFDIGNAGITAATIVTAHGLANTGTINLTGGAVSPDLAELNIIGAAPTTWTGSANLSGDALLAYASGGITAIGAGAELSLNGALSRVSSSTKTGSNSALTGVASNAGGLTLANGAVLVTTTGLTNTGSIDIDSAFFFGSGGDAGGSSLTVGGALTNQGSLEIGNSALATASTVTAAGLANSGTIILTGGTAQANLKITGAAGNTDFVSLSDSALAITAGFTNSSTVFIDQSGAGGSRLTVGGTLTNSGFGLDIGNAGITAATIVTAAGLSNTGAINLSGGTAVQATLNIAAAAPAIWTGTAGLAGDALLEYKSGGITAIGSGAQLSLSGALSRVALSTATTSNSALTKLAANAGSFSLADGTVITTTAFNNSGSVFIDQSGGGGSRLTIGGTLTNSGFGFDIGNAGITAATIVTAAGLANTGTINLTGGAVSADLAELNVTAAAPASWTGLANLSGDALLEYKSGGITAIGAGASLSLGGAQSLVALNGKTTTNSALTGLASNAGTFSLANGAVLTTTTGFTNTGTMEVDTSFGGGGSKLTVGGSLTNSSFLEIGNFGLATAATVTAAGLANGGTIELTGGAARASLKITGTAANTGSISLSNSVLAITGGFTDSGTVELDAFSSGGSGLTVGTTLTIGNFDTLDIGNAGITTATTASAAGLSNTGTINLSGGAARASLNIAAAAPATWTGTANLSGNALLEYKSGGITAIGSGAGISLNGAKSLVALSTALSSNSALTGLASNAGTFSLAGGAALTTTTAFNNSGSTAIDTSFGGGGSGLTVGGTLTNSSSLSIGNSGLTSAATVTAAGLANTGTISLTGASGTDTGTLTLTGASSDAGSITISAGGVLHLGNTLTVTGSLALNGGTVSGGTLAGTGTIETGFFQTGTLSALTIAAGATFTAEFGSTLIDNGVTVSGTLNGSGSATLDFAKTGTDSLTNVSGFTTIGLATGAANTLTLATANFTGTSGVITVNDGNSGNTVSGSALTSANSIIVNAGTGADLLTGGAGNDVFFAGGDTSMTGKAGTNQFVFSAPGSSNTIKDFGTSSTNELVFSNSGFSLGQSGASSTPQALSASLFTSNSTGAFSTTSQRLAYDTANGQLFSSTDGSGSSSHLVATLSDHHAISAATQLFFIT